MIPNEWLSEEALRYGAIVAAAVLFGWQYLVDAVKAGWKVVPKKLPTPTPVDPTLADMRTVLDLANRLRLRNCEEGVDLCQQLIDVMLTANKGKK